MGKINNPAVFNWQPVFNEMAMGCDVTVPVSTVDDFRLLLNACFEDARRAKYRTLYYRYNVFGSFHTHFGEAKVSFKEKNQSNPIKPSGKASNASAVAKTIMLMPIAVREPRSSQTIRTDPISVLRPIVG